MFAATQLKEVENKLRELEKKEKVLIDDNASLINIFQEELKRSDAKVERLRERLRVRTTSIDLHGYLM